MYKWIRSATTYLFWAIIELYGDLTTKLLVCQLPTTNHIIRKTPDKKKKEKKKKKNILINASHLMFNEYQIPTLTTQYINTIWTEECWNPKLWIVCISLKLCYQKVITPKPHNHIALIWLLSWYFVSEGNKYFF